MTTTTIVRSVTTFAPSLFLFAVTYASPAYAQRATQAQILNDLRSGDLRRQVNGADKALEIPRMERSSQLWAVLFAELERATAADEREAATRWEETPEEEMKFEYLKALTTAVAESDDPEAIPLLIPRTDSSPVAAKGIAKFGEQAVEPLLAALGEADQKLVQVVGILLTLKEILDYSSTAYPLTLESRDRIVATLPQYLLPSNDAMIIGTAARTAAATGDEELLKQVKLLAEDPRRLLPAASADDLGSVQALARQALRERRQKR
jgi:hypothetical protein